MAHDGGHGADDRLNGTTEERRAAELKADALYRLTTTCERIAEHTRRRLADTNVHVEFEPDVLQRVAEIAAHTVEHRWAPDLRLFATHANRAVPTVDDARMLFRRSAHVQRRVDHLRLAGRPTGRPLEFGETHTITHPVIPGRQHPAESVDIMNLEDSTEAATRLGNGEQQEADVLNTPLNAQLPPDRQVASTSRTPLPNDRQDERQDEQRWTPILPERFPAHVRNPHGRLPPPNPPLAAGKGHQQNKLRTPNEDRLRKVIEFNGTDDISRDVFRDRVRDAQAQHNKRTDRPSTAAAGAAGGDVTTTAGPPAAANAPGSTLAKRLLPPQATRPSAAPAAPTTANTAAAPASTRPAQIPRPPPAAVAAVKRPLVPPPAQQPPNGANGKQPAAARPPAALQTTSVSAMQRANAPISTACRLSISTGEMPDWFAPKEHSTPIEKASTVPVSPLPFIPLICAGELHGIVTSDGAGMELRLPPKRNRFEAIDFPPPASKKTITRPKQNPLQPHENRPRR
ncbi:hypothetical protein M3Y99_00684900 [Aphelenchoides fujianensis]|nr:hypothetical protein M3Y99_00684900 [Aphelenchoides fujianensis]